MIYWVDRLVTPPYIYIYMEQGTNHQRWFACYFVFCVCTLIEQKEPTPEIVDLPFGSSPVTRLPMDSDSQHDWNCLVQRTLKKLFGFCHAI